jgi:6-phosphofructokinase 2
MKPRLATLTLNPALDIACSAEVVRPTNKIRTSDDHFDPGGGGVNVARVLHELDGDTLAVIMAGGVTGALIEEMLDKAGVPRITVPIHGITRICFTALERSTGLEYRFVPEGPSINRHDWHSLLQLLEEVDCDWLIASGSLEHGMPEDIYARVARAARRRGQRVVLDCSGQALSAALGAGLEMIKPSLGELRALVGLDLPDDRSQEEAAVALVRQGAARLVAVSLGKAGAFVASEEGVIRITALPSPVLSAVGAGDSFVAAMSLGLARGATLEEALRWGVAAGTAAVMCAGTARLRRQDVERQYERLRAVGA